MSANAWFSYPLDFHSSRAFECDDLNQEQCAYYQERWHFWYIADWVFGLSTIAFSISMLGIFVLAYVGTMIRRLEVMGRVVRATSVERSLALFRYLTYRGFYIELFGWYSASVGLLALAFCATVFFFCMDLIPQPYYWPSEIFGHSPPLGTRSGWMALALMPFVFATASKTNWITLFTGISYERLQVFHRWSAYAFWLLALMHTFPFIVYHTIWGDIVEQVTVDNLFTYWTGIVALILQAWLTFASHSVFRNRAYEFFKIMHFIAIILFVVAFFWHCGGTLTSWDYFVATAAIYIPCFVFPILRTIFEHGLNLCAEIEIEENGFIVIRIPGKFDAVPGQHCFLRFATLGVHSLTAHPFTVCPPMGRNVGDNDESMTFYVKRHRGFTARLHSKILKGSFASLRVLVDGPYGGIDTYELQHSDRVVLVCGGSGASWSLAILSLFLDLHKHDIRQAKVTKTEMSSETSDTDERVLTDRRASIRLITAVRDPKTCQWYANKVGALILKYQSLDQDYSTKITIDLHITAQGSSSDTKISSQVPSGDLILGRPDLPVILRQEAGIAAENQAKLAIFSCGPASMQHDVRNAVALENLAIMKGPRGGTVYLHQEHFSWA